MAKWWQRLTRTSPASEAQYRHEVEQIRQSVPIPTLWLFGKTGSGKSSVVRFLTGAEAATIGAGYRPETKASQRFDFPTSLDPLMTFLDTRGLGEASYNPTEDIARFAGSAELLIVTVRVTDHALQGVIDPLQRIRQNSPERPVILVLTCLHQAVDSDSDISEGADPFAASQADPAAIQAVPESLAILIAQKREQFKGLFDIAVPVDLTQPSDGFADPDFGGIRLKEAILEYLPHAYRQALIGLDRSKRPFETDRQMQARWQVLASSAMAGTAGAVPLPWVDIPAVLAIQAHLAYRIADIYQQELNATQWAVLSSAAGSHVAFRLAIRSTLKLIPLVGMAANAAGSFAITYALGMSWDWYFADLKHGGVPSAEKLREVFAEQLKLGRELWGEQAS